MLVLGIESSCDETAIAILCRDPEKGVRILSHLIFSQVKEHALYGGIVPEVAARAHIFHIHSLVAASVEQAGIRLTDINLIAVTSGPGLIGSLTVGLMMAKGLALGLNIPLVEVNHLAAHVLVSMLSDNAASFPYAALLVSGGHTQVIHVQDVDSYTILVTTKDDALGEVFDKVARMLGLGYPGGPEIEKRAALAEKGNLFTFPKPMFGSKEPYFSFSGLKTAVRQTIEKIKKEQDLSDSLINELACSFQNAAIDAVCNRLKHALSIKPFSHFCVVGGVASNKKMREKLNALASQLNLTFNAPPPQLCTDNAAMIAFAGLLSYEKKSRNDLWTATPRARWPVGEIK